MKWIDFGKTAKTERPLKHDIPWVSGSSEEGLLTGIRNLIDIFFSLSESTAAASIDLSAATSDSQIASNENKDVTSEKPVASNDTRVVKRSGEQAAASNDTKEVIKPRKKNFFIDMFKICSRTLSKPAD